MFFINIFGQRLPVLGDSGCTGSCISIDFYHANPNLKKLFVPRESCGMAINGSSVQAIGETRLEFHLGTTEMSIRCKIIKGLMDPIVLGWDWMSKYGVTMDTTNGMVRFGEDGRAPLIENEALGLGSFYCTSEDVILPPFSKVHTCVELTGRTPMAWGSTSVVTEPFACVNGQYGAARTCSNVFGDRFMTEFGQLLGRQCSDSGRRDHWPRRICGR